MGKDHIHEELDRFGATLAHIAESKQQGRLNDVAKAVGRELKRLLGAKYDELVKLTEVEMLAGLIKGAPGFWVPYRMAMLIALLKEAGDFATAQYPPHGGYGWYLKALHLLLDSADHEGLGGPTERVPTVETLLAAIGRCRLPIGTRLLLMRDYERRGDFARVRDEFNAALARAPNDPKLLDFGIVFFERIAGECDAALTAGQLPRTEIQAILDRLLRRKNELGLHQAGTTKQLTPEP